MWIILIIILILILINGFFAASEMALVTISQRDIDKMINDGEKNANILKNVTKDSVKYLSTIQVAITFAGFLSSAFAGSKLSSNLVNLFMEINISLSQSFALIIVTIILSYISLVLGELVPKRIALQNAKAFALFSCKVINISMIISKPFVDFLSLSTNIILKILRVKPQTTQDQITEKEIKELIVSGHYHGLYRVEEKNMLERIFRFDDLKAETIMTPRVDVFAVDINDFNDYTIDEIMETGFSRIPFYQDKIDNIIGILLVKDLLKELKDKKIENLNIKNLLRESYVVSEHIKINVLLTNLKKQKQHLAILVDEYGGFQGIVTMEDILEEIVGNIYDEYDEIDTMIVKQNHNTFLVDAKIQIQELNLILNTNIDENSSEFDTLAGFIINYLGYIPNSFEDEISYNNFRIKIIKTNDNRIEKVRIIFNKDTEFIQQKK